MTVALERLERIVAGPDYCLINSSQDGDVTQTWINTPQQKKNNAWLRSIKTRVFTGQMTQPTVKLKAQKEGVPLSNLDRFQ